MSQAKGAIKAKAGNGKGFMIDGQEGWFNATTEALLAPYNKGDVVTITYEQKGMTKNVTSILGAASQGTSAPVATPPVQAEASGPVCTDCGAKLKNDKFTKCYTCNQKNPAPKKQWSGSAKKADYSSPERTAQIQRGNALNAAAAVLAQRQEDPETISEMVLVVADRFLQWLRAE